MAKPAGKKAAYEDLYNIPENMTGEIIDGKLVVHPRPSRKHIYAASRLVKRLGSPYELGEGGGPGGWIILVKPEIQFGEHTMVPDLAGWKRERFPVEEETNWISVAPDCVCEIISPSTYRLDKMTKMPIYADHGVGYLWLMDPAEKTLDTYELQSNRWFLAASFYEDDKVKAEPFQEIEFDLGDLWLDYQRPASDSK